MRNYWTRADLPLVTELIAKIWEKSYALGSIFWSLNVLSCHLSRIWSCRLPAAVLAQLDKRRFAEWEAAGSSPGRTNTQGL